MNIIGEVREEQSKAETDSNSRESPTSDEADDHFVVVAIDFGSRYSGYMYGFKSELKKDPSKIIGKRWGCGSCKLVSAKTDTAVLFKSDQCVAFGYEAEEQYVIENVCNGDKVPNEYVFFRNFKMQLYDKERVRRTFKLSNDRGQRVSAMKVFSEAIAYLKNDAMKSLKDKAEISERDVLWVITVPAIWTESAKHFMREATIKAGINRRKLILALEPEVAAIYCKEIELQKQNPDLLQPGLKFMVLDLGGGTVDVTVYEVQADDTLNEIHAASGGAWGGENVNKAFMDVWKSILGKEKYAQFLTDYQDDVILFRNGFESLKKQMDLQKNRKYIIQMPEYFKEEIGVESLNSLLKEKYGDEITIGKGKIFLSSKFMLELFQEPIRRITEHVRDIFSRVNDLGRVIMVGGFSEAGVLKDKLREEFPDVRFFIPEECNSAVMKGAVMYGFKNSYIGRRISRYSYGVSHRVPFDAEKHPALYLTIVDGKPMCDNVFKAFVHAGDKLVPGQTNVKHRFRATSNPATVELYASMERNPVYITDACYIGEVKIHLQEFKHSREVEVTMHFGNAAFTMSMVDTKTGDLKQSNIEQLK